MKKLFLVLLFSVSIIRISAEIPQVDSLKKLLATTKEDTVKVMALVKLSFYDQSFQHGLDLAQEGLALARKIKYEKGEAAALHQIANQYIGINDPIALHYYLKALKIGEHINNKNSMAASYNAIGIIYQRIGDYKNAIIYMQKAVSMHQDNIYLLALVNSNIGNVSLLLKKQDSALKYYQRSYEYYNLSKDKYQFNLTLNGLGTVQLNMGHKELALDYFREALRNGISYNDTTGLSSSYLRIAKLYDAEGQRDSSISYAKLSMFHSQRAYFLENVIESGKLLSRLYNSKNDNEAALRCLQISLAAKDSLFSRERTMQIQNLLFNEAERQSEIAEKLKKDAAERKLNIQYGFIALSIIAFLILFIVLSRSIIVTEKWISFFGILGLLIVFEFINLLIHPFLGTVTNHTPALMLLALVFLASLLVPMHHRLQRWIKEKMIAKNKRIRLANARKTIEKLEGN
jgi:tetratricopeptide (TPR) repeat protein